MSLSSSCALVLLLTAAAAAAAAAAAENLTTNANDHGCFRPWQFWQSTSSLSVQECLEFEGPEAGQRRLVRDVAARDTALWSVKWRPVFARGEQISLQDGQLSDVQLLRTSSESLVVCARIGAHLLLLSYHVSSQQWRSSAVTQVFPPEATLSSHKYPWLVSGETIVIQTNYAMRFYTPSTDFSKLGEVADPDGIFSSYLIMSDSNIVRMGHFYPDAADIGILSKTGGQIMFHKVDLTERDEALLRLPIDDLDDIWTSNTTLYFIDRVSPNGGPDSFILIDDNVLAVYGFDDSYKLQRKLSSQVPLASANGNIIVKFANLTGQLLKDLMIFNDLGLFLYQYRAVSNEYVLLDVDTAFSRNRGWHNHDSVSVIALAQFDGLAFSGSQGFSLIRFDLASCSWQVVDDSSHLHYSSVLSSIHYRGKTIIFSQSTSGLQWGHLQQSKGTPQSLVPPDLAEEKEETEFFWSGKKGSVEQTTLRLPVEKPVLRWSERWPDHFGKEAVKPANGAVSFELPLVNVTVSPLLAVSLNARYDSQQQRVGMKPLLLLGHGWQLNLMQDFILIDYQQSIYPADHKYYISREGVVLPLIWVSQTGLSITYSVNNDSAHTVLRDSSTNTWVYTHLKVQRTYGSCSSGTNAVQWSLGWPWWRGPGTDLNALQPAPAAWYLCQTRDKTTDQELAYHYHTDWYSFPNDKKILTSMRLESISDGNGVTIAIKYGEKNADEYDVKSFYDEINNVYRFPTPLVDKYYVTDILTETLLFQQHLTFSYKQMHNKRALIGLSQGAKYDREYILRWEYSDVGDYLVLSKYTCQNNLVVSYGYRRFSNPMLYPPVTDLPLFSAMKMAQANEYVVTAYPNYMNTRQLNVNVMNKMGTHLVHKFTVSATQVVEAFEVRALDQHLIFLLLTKQGMEMVKFAKEENGWSERGDVTMVGENATVSTFEGVVVYMESGRRGVYVLEWDTVRARWNTTILPSPSLTRCQIQSSAIACYGGNELWVFYKQTTAWQKKVLAINNWRFSECDVLRNFNYSGTSERELCDFMKQRSFQFEKNQVFSASVSMDGDIMTLRGLFILLNDKFEVAQSKIIEIYSENVMNKIKEMEVPFDGGKRGKLYMRHAWSNGKIVMQIYDVGGEAFREATSEQRKQFISDQNGMESLRNSSLVDWSNFTAVLTPHGVQLSSGAMYKVTGSSWAYESESQRTFVPLGRTFTLTSEDDQRFELVEKKSLGADKVVERFQLWDRGQMLNRYPEYIAYHSAVNTVELITFADGDTLGTRYRFSNEKIIFASGYQSLMTIANTSSTSLAFSTAQFYRVRPISSLQAKTAPPTAVLSKCQDGADSRLTGYERSFVSDPKELILTQTVSVIPAADKALSGWVQQKTRFDILRHNSTSKTFTYDNKGDELPTPAPKTPTALEENGMDQMGKNEILWDKSGEWQISNFFPYSLPDDESDYYGFEDYELVRSWRFNRAHVVRNHFSFTGRNFLSLKEGSVLRRDLTPRYQDGTFIASCWVRSQQPPPVGKSTKIFSAQITNSNGTNIIKLLAETKRIQGAWQYLEIRIDFSLIHEIYKAYVSAHYDQVHLLPAPEVVQFQIQLEISGESTVDVDHVRFSPFGHDFSANVYDVSVAAITEKISSIGLVTRSRYNHLGQRLFSVTETGQVEEIVSSSHTARFFNQSTSLRSRQITIIPLRGFAENFDELSFEKRWRTDFADKLQVAPYQLIHKGGDWHLVEAVSKFVSAQSLLLRLEFTLAGRKSSLKIAWRGSVIKLGREYEQTFIECSNLKQRIPPTGELIFFINNERTLALVDGIEVVDMYQDNDMKTFLQMSLRGDVMLQNLVVAEEPQIELQYQNGWGDVVQVVQLETASNVRVTETLYDKLGRGAITTKTTRLTRHHTQPLIAMVHDFVENRAMVWQVGRMTGLVDKLNADDGGYPYTKTEYHPNPLNQKKAEGLPGAQFSVGGQFKKHFSTNSNSVDFLTNLFPPRSGFRQETVFEPNESVHVSVFDKNNNNVAKYTLVPGYDDILSTYEYNDDNKLIKILPPLYHEKIGTFSRTEPWKFGTGHLTDDEKKLEDEYGTFFVFDKKGNLVVKKTPDAGVIEYLYNSQGYMRFSYTVNATTNLAERITYYEHDVQGQITETGQISKPTSRKDLSALLESKYIPGKEIFQQTQFDDSNTDPNLRGRSQMVVTNTGDGTILDRIVYNADREVTAKSTVPVTDSSSLEAPSSLNKTFIGKKLHSIHYPVEIGGKPLKLVHGYNGAGQLISLGMGDHPDLFLTFSYHGSGTLASEQYNVKGGAFTRRYEYNSPGYLQAISDPFLDQATTYTSGGYGQVGFGDGIIMSSKFTPHWHNKANPRHFAVDVSRLPASKYSAMCMSFLREKGVIDSRNVPVKKFEPKQLTDLPLLCWGALSYRLATLLAEAQPAALYGHCYAYGNHRELVKAKYFSSPDSQCFQPLQPLTFSAEISEITPAMSIEIFDYLTKGEFVVSDRIRYNVTYATGLPGNSVVRSKEIKSVLDSLSPQDITIVKFINSIELMIKHSIIRQEFISHEQFLRFVLSWDREPGRGGSASEIATALYDALTEKKLLPSAGNKYEYLDSKFLASLSKYKSNAPQIARILLTKFQNSIGSSPFDLMSFEIDPNGNHRKFTVGYETYTLEYLESTNKINTVELRSILTDNEAIKFAMRHDSRGNVIQAMHKGILDISYCATSHRTKAITLQDGRRIFFFYDAKGERVLKQVADSAGRVMHETHYLRDDEGRVLVERSIRHNPSPIAPDTLLTAYIYGPRGLVGFIRNEHFFSVTSDHTGSVRLIVLNGKVVAAYDYLPYGQIMRQYGDDPAMQIAYRYTGQEYDEETGLYNYHARLYDPSIGRFYQPDPQAQYFSPYKYAGNSPVALFDPDGEFAFLIAAIVLAVIGAYVGGAAANGTWNITKWEWNAKTILGALMGAITGFFLPFGIWGSFAVLAPMMGSFLAATTVTVLGIGGAYMMGALTQGLNPLEWKWSEPQLWDAMINGFATGSGIIGSIANVHTIGAKAAQWASSAKRLAIIQKFARFVKPVVIGSSYLSGATVAYVSAMAANENNPAFWQWDWGNIQTWAGLINGFDGGVGLPENFISVGGGLTKGLKNRKNLLTSLKTVSASKVKGLFKALTNKKSAFFKTASAALMAWAMGSNANGDFFDWDWKSFGTYQGIFNGAFTGKGIVHVVSTRATKKQMKAFVVSLKMSAKHNFITVKNAISRMLHDIVNFHKNIGPRGIEIVRKFAKNFGSDTAAGYWARGRLKNGDRFIHPDEVGNRRGNMESDFLGDKQLKALDSFHESAVKAEQDSSRVFVDDDVSFMSCNKHLRRRKRTLGGGGLMNMCSLAPFIPPDEAESSELFIKNRENRHMIQAVMDKTPKAHSANNVIFYPEYILGGVNVHLRTEAHSISDGYLHQKFEEAKEKKQKPSDKTKKNQSFDQTIVLVHEHDVNNQVLVTIKKMITDTKDENLAGYQKDWTDKKIVDVDQLKTLLMAKGVTDSRNVHINAELTVLHIKRRDKGAAEHSIHFCDGQSMSYDNLQNLDQPIAYKPFYSKEQTPERFMDLQTHVANYIDNNEGSQNYEVQMQAARKMTIALLEMYHEKRKSQGVADSKPKEAEFHAFLYGALEMNVKRKHQSDVIVESVVGKGELDMVLFFRKNAANIRDNWESIPIIFELKSGDVTRGEASDNFRGKYPGLSVEVFPDSPDSQRGYSVACYPLKASGSIQQITRKGYQFNLPLKTIADKVVIVGVDSFINFKPSAEGHVDHSTQEKSKIENSVQVDLLTVPKYEGLVDHLVKKGTANSMDIMEQIIQQYYSYSPYSNKKRVKFNENSSFGAQERVDPSTYMGRFAMGEVLSRPQETYVHAAKTDRDPMVALFKGDDGKWVLMQVVDGHKGIKGEVIVPDNVPLDQITSLRIEAQKELVDTNEKVHLYNNDPMKPLHASKESAETTSFVKVDPIDARSLLAPPLSSNSSPFEPILKGLESQLKKFPKSCVDEGDVQAVLHGALVGNQGLFQANGKDLRVRPESSLTALGRIDLLVTVTDHSYGIPRDQYLNVVEMKYVKNSPEPDRKRQKPDRLGGPAVDKRMERELVGAVEQAMGYFKQHHLEALTDKNIVESTAVVANDRGDIYYAIMEVTLGRKPHIPPTFRLKTSNAIDSLPPPPSRRRRDIAQEESAPATLSTISSFSIDGGWVSNQLHQSIAVNETVKLSRRQFSDRYARGLPPSSSSADRPQLWPIQLIKSIFSTLSIMWSSSSTVGPKRSFNKLREQVHSQSKINSDSFFSVLDMGDAWLAETNVQGNLLWLTIAMHKLTGIRPYNNADPYNLRSQQYMQLMQLLAGELTYELQTSVCVAAAKCGITPLVRGLMCEVDIAMVRESVYHKLMNGQIDDIAPLLYSELVGKYRGRVALMSTRKQADKWVSAVLGATLSG